MNSLTYINDILRKEKCLLIIAKDAEYGLWKNRYFGGSRINNINKDYLIITEYRILYIINNKTIIEDKYSDFSTITFNSTNDTISYNGNDQQTIHLKSFRLDYEEIQEIKKVLINK